MPFSALPLEILQEILFHAISDRGWKRGMRLRLVSKHFANEVQQCLYSFRMLDQFFRSNGSLVKNFLHPPYTAPYLEYRVRNEPQGGCARLVLIREIAEKIHLARRDTQKGSGEFDLELSALCSLSVENGSLCKIFEPSPLEEDEAGEGLYVAAIYRNIHHIILERAPLLGTFGRVSSLFGSVGVITARYGTKETLEIVHLDARTDIRRAAQSGRIETLRYLFEKRRWHFDDPKRVKDRIRFLDRVVCIPSVEVWNYVVKWRQKYPEIITDRKNWNLRTAAMFGWTEMVRHLLQLGANTDVNRDDAIWRDTNAIHFACMDGYEEIVRLLIDHSADTKGMMAVAARHGRQRVVQMLIAHGADATGAISEAVIGGHITIVQALLDHGVSIHEVSREAFVFVVKREHTALLKLLFQRTGKWDLTTHQECLKAAKEEALESMEMLLNEYGDTRAVTG